MEGEYPQQYYDYNYSNQYQHSYNEGFRPVPGDQALTEVYQQNAYYPEQQAVTNYQIPQAPVAPVEETPTAPVPQPKVEPPQLKRSVLPVHQFKKKNKPKQQPDRPSSRGSLASDISRADHLHQHDLMIDQYAQWYQMLSHYYKQYYPHMKLPEFKPAPGSSGKVQSMEYANFCYQFYMQAQKQWSDIFISGQQQQDGTSDNGRRTPHLYHTPHMRGSIAVPGLLLQILPARPTEGETARLELLDLNQLANESIAEAALRASNSMMAKKSFLNDQLTTSFTEDDTEDDIGSSRMGTVDDEDDEEDQVTRACADITQAWDRVDNIFFPGPLSRQQTLKADILVYLKEKMVEIQDRLPIDWESASLLLLLLEQLVKNNGVIQSADLVTILLDGHEVKTADLREYGTGVSSMAPANESQHNQYDMSQSPSRLVSGRNSPIQRGARSIASSSISDVNNMHQMILKAAQATAMVIAPRGDQGLEDRALDRYRQLLMNALPHKALEYACRAQLWGHAFALAHRLNQTQKVMEKFQRSALHAVDPVLSLYQLAGGEMPQIVNSVSYTAGVDTGEWRPHLAILLSAKDQQPDLVYASLERLGDSLLSRHLVYAAHVCYLLLDQVRPADYQLPGKVWLLGHSREHDEHRRQHQFELHLDEKAFDDPISVPSEAIQLTEIYEYTRSLKDSMFMVIDLLPYKLAYAIRLLDSGLCEAAYKYVDCVGRGLCYLIDTWGLDRLISQVGFCRMLDICLRLGTRLQYHPDVIGLLIPADPRRVPFVSTPGLQLHCGTEWIARLVEVQEMISKQLGLPCWFNTTPQPPCEDRSLISTDQPGIPFEEVTQKLQHMQLHQQPSHSTPFRQQPQPTNEIAPSPTQKRQPEIISAPPAPPAPMTVAPTASFFNPGVFQPDSRPEAVSDFDFFAHSPIRSRTISGTSQKSNGKASPTKPRSRLSSRSGFVNEPHQQNPPSPLYQTVTAPIKPVVPQNQMFNGGASLDSSNPSNQQNKDGWFSGIFGKLKPKNAVHLPDDSKPTMVYDKEKNRWVDLNNPDGEAEKPPPPPAFPGGKMPMATAAAPKGPRPRYVNPLVSDALPAVTGPVPDLNLMMPPTKHAHKE